MRSKAEAACSALLHGTELSWGAESMRALEGGLGNLGGGGNL